MNEGLLLTYYGDDFTGSTDTMEALVRGGVRTALFLAPPTPERLAQFAGLRAVGIAGTARTMSPAAMDEALPPIFAGMHQLGAPIVHYKMCSTGDSSPEVGSVGHAIDLGQAEIASPFVPVLVATPLLGRYSAFGNLFARSGPESDVFRLDRHPTMSRHPITPMHEADLRLHFGQQTARPIGVFDLLQFTATDEDELMARLRKVVDGGAEVVLLDAMYGSHLLPIGSLLWRSASAEQPLFVVGSSAIENALTEYWVREGVIPAPQPLAQLGGVDQLLVLSGSCSPVTERQTDVALEAGFAEVALRPTELIRSEGAGAAIDAAAQEALALLEQGRSVIVHSARGPNDPRIAETTAALAAMGYDDAAIREHSGRLLGAQLGAIGKAILEAWPMRRVAVSGGDTSSYVMRALGIEALEYKAPFAPAMPFCHVHASSPAVDGTEMIFKGGQTGTVHFYRNVRDDTPKAV
jgi:uncharacterized protein YgbK (DUF1537 family)